MNFKIILIFRNFSKCALDFALSANYHHAKELFPERVDILLQPETIRGVNIIRDQYGAPTVAKACKVNYELKQPRAKTASGRLNGRYKDEEFIVLSGYGPHLKHPLIIGGIAERNSPHSVKLINSGPHTHLTNPGYSRQDSDGNYFRY